MSYTYGLIGISNTQDSTVSNVVRDNVVSFLDWGFLDKGGFQTVSSPASGMYGGSKHLLKPVKDNNYSDGQVWQTFKKNWVWETGVSTSTQPIQISGIYQNNTFLPYSYNATSGYYVGSGYRIDYPNGRVIFNSPIPSTSVVSANYSYKWLSVDKAEGYPFFKQIQQGSFRLDQNFSTGSGAWNQISQNRVQLPAVLVDVLPSMEFTPLQLGGGQYANIDAIFYIISETESSCSNIANAISYQNNRVLQIYDTNSVYKSGEFPINYRGDLINTLYDYRYMIDYHSFRTAYLKDMRVNDITQLTYDLFISTARCTFEVRMPEMK